MKDHDIQLIRECWRMVFPSFPISDRQLAIWLVSHDPSVVRQGIARAAVRYEQLHGEMDNDYILRFASSVMNRLSAERKEAA